jgi:hypothetical protein
MGVYVDMRSGPTLEGFPVIKIITIIIIIGYVISIRDINHIIVGAL